MYIACVGMIGSGKSTLVKELSEILGWDHYLESDGSLNPHLENYYLDPPSHAYQSQLYFLEESLNQTEQIVEKNKPALQDRFWGEHLLVFCQMLKENKYLSEEDCKKLERRARLAPSPDLILYLNSSLDSCLQRLKQRGNTYEKSLDLEYLQTIDDKHKELINDWEDSEILILNREDFDFTSTEDLEEVARVIKEVDEKMSLLYI